MFVSIRTVFYICIALTFVSACKSKHPKETEHLDPKLLIYRGSQAIVNDLIHTKLELKPDFKKRDMKGTAFITLQAHFYPVDSLHLDAVYMQILKVELIKNSIDGKPGRIALGYRYDSLKLHIGLDKLYTKEESYTVVIDYIAQPDKIPVKGSRAITGRHGLYFIQADGKVNGKPEQLWTQGETQAASCWFPTIDAPNQKTSQELSVELPLKYKSISNGILLRSEKVSDSSRIDYWKQDLPHAPYLFAMVIGDFAEIKDKWRNKDVHYFVEPAYAQYARLVFGNTPEMLTFYSAILGVEYPWDKFHQVVVRDFVSGAMENTGTVVHFDRLQHDSREHLDETYEDVIAHELFHHWFGDLITCESWSNIPLNESFATYGEYLWNEYKYGRNQADYKLDDFHESYLSEAAYKSENLIRYYYGEQEEMFDAHSYQKGGSVLHMLRKYTGDEAFFASLNLYLKTNKFKTVELSDLRKAFEEITGEDLNWFFDQWFLNSGHPTLEVNHTFNTANGYTITVIQKEKKFRLPIDIDVYGNTGKQRMRVIISKDTQIIRIPAASETSYVQFDAENQFLGFLYETKSNIQWQLQLEKSLLAAHKIAAYQKLMQSKAEPGSKEKYCRIMLKDSFWYCRVLALNSASKKSFDPIAMKAIASESKSEYKNESVAAVRKAYVGVFVAAGDEETIKTMLYDSSYDVMRRSLSALGQLNKKAAFAFADENRNNDHRKMKAAVYNSIGYYSTADESSFFIQKIKDGNSETVEAASNALAVFMVYNQNNQADASIDKLVVMADDTSHVGESANAVTALKSLYNYYYYQMYYMQTMIAMNKKYKAILKEKLSEVKRIYKRLDILQSKYK